MVADRRVSAGEVTRYVSEMQQEINRLQQRLENLRQASAGAGSQKRRGRPAAAAPRGRRSGRVTAEQRASRQLQGRYLGLLRQIPASRRGPFQKTARERGREAAIKDLTSALAK
ncbi:MAG TPA: hypothetical protein VNA04_06760 [Thermoanaerobaculia bacterium]|nr:hypothetical protein [Thermoanaerobaculia bacterium]